MKPKRPRTLLFHHEMLEDLYAPIPPDAVLEQTVESISPS